MREPAFNTIALMLTVYVAALVWGIQHVSDKYSPKLLMIFFRRIALLPLVALVVMLFVAGILLFPHALTSILTFGSLQLPLGDVLSFALLVAAVALVIAAVSWMVSSLAKGMSIISWLRKRKDQVTILEDILTNLIQRDDVRLTRESLSLALRGKPESRQDVIDWLQDHRPWLSINWLARELIVVILSPSLDTKAANIYDDLLCVMLAEALDKEDSNHAYFVLDNLCDALSKAKPWTNAHMNLLCHIGFTLWKIGDYSASAPRTTRIPEQLEGLRWLFLSRLRHIQYNVLHLKDADAVYHFILALCELIREATNTKDLCETLLSRVYDVLVDGYHEHVLNAEALEELVNALGHIRHEMPDSKDEDTQTEIDSYILASLAILVELGEKEDTILHAAGNGYMMHRITKGRWSSTYKLKSKPYYYYWLSPEYYTTALKILGVPGLSRKQAKELIDGRAAIRPVEIQVGLETVTDEVSHLLSGSSPTSPILIEVHHTNLETQI